MQNTEINQVNPVYIFIDGSYFCFYRYFALLNWWRNAFPEEQLDDPIQNPMFVDKFKKTFIETLQKIPKKLNIEPKKCRKVKEQETNKPIFIVGKDCKRENIWRNKFYDKYKATRANGQDDGFMGGPFLRWCMKNPYFNKAAPVLF